MMALAILYFRALRVRGSTRVTDEHTIRLETKREHVV